MQVFKDGRLREVCATLPRKVDDWFLYNIYLKLLYGLESWLCEFPYEERIPPGEYTNFFCNIQSDVDLLSGWLQYRIYFGRSSFKFICWSTCHATGDKKLFDRSFFRFICRSTTDVKVDKKLRLLQIQASFPYPNSAPANNNQLLTDSENGFNFNLADYPSTSFPQPIRCNGWQEDNHHNKSNHISRSRCSTSQLQ